MKTAVSVPDEVFEEADQLASLLGLSRSELYTRALRSYLAEQFPDDVTQRLDAVLSDDDSAPDWAAIAKVDLIDSGLWEW